MTPERWKTLQETYFSVAVMEPSARPGFLDDACRGDGEMRKELESLLACENKIGQFLEQTAIEVLVAEYGPDLAEREQEGKGEFVGELIDDRYIVREHIGSGGTGDVYRAVHRLLETPVAIKRLAPDLRNIQEHRRRFVQEARKAVLLDHENVTKVKDVVERGDEVFVVMEYIDGETLRARMKRPISTDEFLDLAAQCAAAVAAAHRERIVHLDLKPENIMITAAGKVKICDFGVARQLPSADENGADESRWSFAGTPSYMAPEVIESNRFDARADIFSLGVVFFEILAGEHPFRSDEIKVTMNRVLNEPASRLLLTGNKVPRRVVRLVERMVSKDPKQRVSADDVFSEVKIIQRRRGYIRQAWNAVAATPAYVARKPLRAAAILLTALIGVAPLIFAPHFFYGLVSSARSPSPRLLVVLPFTNIGGDPTNQAFCDGLVETLTTKLSLFERFQNAFRVVPASEVRGEGVSTAGKAKVAFGAAFAITGSVQRLGDDRIRLIVNLIDTASLVQDSVSIDQRLVNLPAIQDSVVMKVAELLNGRLPRDAAAILGLGQPTIAAANEPYVQGRGRLERYQNPADVDAAIDLFQRALAIDQRYALAYAALGEAYWRKYELTKEPQFANLANQNCQTALKLESGLGPIYVTLALVANGTGRYEDAAAQAKRALAIDLLNADAYIELAKAYQYERKLADAESTYQQAIAARPNDWSVHNHLGSFYFKQARFAEAEAQFHSVLESAPDNVRAWSNLGAAYQQMKRYPEAERALTTALNIRPTASAYSNLGTIYYYRLHRPDAAAQMFEKAATLDGQNYKWWRNAASAYVNWGESARARAAYEKAINLAEHERQTNPRNQQLLVALADCYAMTGQGGLALDYIGQAIGVAPLDTNQMAAVAEVYEELGQRALAIEWVGRAMRGGYSRDLIESSLSLAALRSDPAFQAISTR